MDAFVLDPSLLVILGVIALSAFATEGRMRAVEAAPAVGVGAALAIRYGKSLGS